jgi:type V secretory pathway adhesin AidA
MTKDEALKLALEELDNLLYWDNGKSDYDQAREAITAIKQALAAPVQEPLITDENGRPVKFWGGKATQPAQPAPVQEPTVWTATRLWNRRELWTCPADIERDLLESYTTPPAAQRQWVGLKDQDMKDALISVDPETKRLPIGFILFGRAIEAKLKEKNT